MNAPNDLRSELIAALEAQVRLFAELQRQERELERLRRELRQMKEICKVLVENTYKTHE